MSKWLKANGKPIMDSHNRPYDCPTCPCATPVPVECSEAVDAEIQTYLDMLDPETQQHIWTLYGTYEAAYTCAEWAYDDSDSDGVMEWRLVHPASGYLLIALKHGEIVTDTTSCYEEKLVYAKTIYNFVEDRYMTIGCQCRVVDHECKHRMVSLDDYLIAGQLHVWWEGEDASESDSGVPEYLPSYSCQVNPCDLLKLKLETAQYWHGGTLMGEGYYDWLLTPQVWQSSNYHYQPFLMALKWAVETSDSESSSSEPIYNLTFIDCACTSITTHTLQEGESCLEYSGICDMQDPCIDMMLLHNQAMENGWTWHGEGVLVHLATIEYSGTRYFGDWYAWRYTEWWNNPYDEFSAYEIYRACADTGDTYHLVTCGCSVVTKKKIYDDSQPASSTNPANYRLYLDMDGICNCNTGADNYPDRELLLTYPDVFGVIDTCYGNHAKFAYTYTTYEHNPDEGDVTCNSEGVDVCGQDYEPVQGHGGRTMYIDYRALCVISKGFWQDGTVMDMVRVLYPSDSEAAYWYQNIKRLIVPATSDAFYGRHGFYETAEFTGTYYTPFTDDTEIYHEQTCSNGYHYENRGKKFSGWNYSWFHEGWQMDMYVNGCQPTETCGYDSREQAEEEAGCNGSAPTPCIGIMNTASHLYDKTAILSPDFTVVDHPCSIREIVHDYSWEEDGETYHWYESEWCATKRWITIGVDVGNCNWLMLNVNYVRTNKGLLVKGLGGYVDSYVLLGASNFPQYTDCWSEECKNPEVQFDGEVYDPCHWLDETITCTPHLDWLSCLGWTDWGDESDSDSSSSSN